LFALQIPEYAAKALALGVHTERLTWGDFLFSNLLPVTLGNVIGGVALGALLWLCHLHSRTGKRD
jgi:formate/nitrite transporter FocA (FNT family)